MITLKKYLDVEEIIFQDLEDLKSSIFNNDL